MSNFKKGQTVKVSDARNSNNVLTQGASVTVHDVNPEGGIQLRPRGTYWRASRFKSVAPAKKTAATKTAAKKSAAKKTATKKVAAKKTSAKKGNKTTARKTAKKSYSRR